MAKGRLFLKAWKRRMYPVPNVTRRRRKIARAEEYSEWLRSLGKEKGTPREEHPRVVMSQTPRTSYGRRCKWISGRDAVNEQSDR